MSAMNNNKEDNIIDANEFNPNTDYKYIKPKINKSGGKSVGILNSESNKALYLSTPLMLTWGVTEFKDEATGRKAYNMSLQFPKDEYASDETNAFLKAMTEFQNKIKRDAIENSKEWLNKNKMTPDVVDALFHPMLYYPKDPETGEPNTNKSPTLKIKLDYWDEQFNCEIYDVNSNILFPSKDDDHGGPMELMPKATNILTVIRCGGLWFANGKFGCTWRLVQSVVQPRATMKGRCLIKVDKESVDKLKEQALKQETDDQNSDDEVDKTAAQDSDDEESDVPTKEPEPEPVVEEEEKPKPKKRKVVKRKVKD